MGFQWFGISRLDPEVAAAGVRSAAPFAEQFLDDTMAKYGLDESKTVLIGFSQGTMMALHVGLRRKKPLAGIVGFSGMLAAPDALKDEIKSKPPVLLVHGDSHVHRFDQPLRDPASGRLQANFTRLETWGSPFMGWVKVDVAPGARPLFRVTPRMYSARGN